MKKIVMVLSLLIAVTVYKIPCHSTEVNTKQSVIRMFKPAADTKEAIYRDMLISLLVPYMQKEINNYYKEYLTELPMIFPYSVDIVNVKRKYSGFLIDIEVIAHPFVGPNLTVGDDKFIIETGAFGSVDIKKFEHLKSYQLPWNYQNIIKRPF